MERPNLNRMTVAQRDYLNYLECQVADLERKFLAMSSGNTNIEARNYSHTPSIFIPNNYQIRFKLGIGDSYIDCRLDKDKLNVSGARAIRLGFTASNNLNIEVPR